MATGGRQNRWIYSALAGAALVAALIAGWTSPARQVDNYHYDWTLRLYPPVSAAKEALVLEIDDETLSAYRGPSGIRPMLADVFESLVAAIFLDGGWEVAKEFVLRFMQPEIDRVAREAVSSNSKSQLQTVVQRQYGGTPRYYLLDEQGPEHDKCFKVAAQVGEHRFPAAWGRTKKEAELKAAVNALAEINGEEIPYPSD